MTEDRHDLVEERQEVTRFFRMLMICFLIGAVVWAAILLPILL